MIVYPTETKEPTKKLFINGKEVKYVDLTFELIKNFGYKIMVDDRVYYVDEYTLTPEACFLSIDPETSKRLKYYDSEPN